VGPASDARTAPVRSGWATFQVAAQPSVLEPFERPPGHSSWTTASRCPGAWFTSLHVRIALGRSRVGVRVPAASGRE
jgi:hypothetical protein